MANKKKTRMYEPWGYQDENNYKSTEILVENDFDAFLVDTSYNKDDNKIYFTNKDGEVKASLDVNEFVKSDSIIEKTEYKDGILKIYFTNGDVVTIDLTELLDENEFKDGLMVDNHVVKVLINSAESDDYISVDINGIKLTGVKADIEAEEARAISAETALDEKIDAEIARATAEEQRIDAKLDQEIADRIADVDAEEARATDEETTIKNTIGGGFSTASTETVTAKFNALSTALDTEIGNRTTQDNQLQNNINTESTARQAADTRLENLITDERNRAKAAEEALDAKIDQEIADREADVDAEEARAISAETALQNAIDAEEVRAEAAEAALQEAIDAEVARATSAETDLQAAIEAEGQRAQDAETALNNAKFDEVVYDSTAKTITFYANTNVVGTVDTTDFVKDGMIDDVKIENDKLVIVFNTDAGKETIEIPLSEIFNPDNYYDKTDIDNIVSGINSSIAAEETRAETVEQGLQESISSEASTARAAEQANAEAIIAEKDRAEAAEALKANSADVDAALALKADKSEIPTDFYTKGEVDGKDDALQAGIDANAEAISAEEARALSAETDLQDAINLKADKETTYTKEEVDALIAEKEAEIVQIKKDYNSLKEIVGELGGNVEWGVPADGTFNNMMKKSGTVKLGEDTTTSTYTGGITSKNKTTLNLNGKNLTFSGTTTTNPSIMTRGEQELTIMGKGTFDAAGRIAVETNGADTVINLSGTTGFFASEPTYVTDRSGGELIYCYLGTINISAGVFKNNGEDKKYLLNCYDANYRAGTAKIVVTGGKFYDFNPADNTAEGEHTSFVPEGYHVEESQDGDSTVYTVKKD